MSFQTVERAIQQQATTATGLTCIWENQSRTRPARPFVSMNIVNMESVSTIGDTLDNPTPSAGAEILVRTTDHLEFTVQFNVYTADIVGVNAARYRAHKLATHFDKETTIDALDLTSPETIAVVGRSPVVDSTTVLETEYEGRASVTITFRTAVTFDDAVTYIETAEFTGTYS